MYTFADACPKLRQIVEGLVYLHDSVDVVHGDLRGVRCWYFRVYGPDSDSSP
jgi:hypothetical protein